MCTKRARSVLRALKSFRLATGLRSLGSFFSLSLPHPFRLIRPRDGAVSFAGDFAGVVEHEVPQVPDQISEDPRKQAPWPMKDPLHDERDARTVATQAILVFPVFRPFRRVVLQPLIHTLAVFARIEVKADVAVDVPDKDIAENVCPKMQRCAPEVVGNERASIKRSEKMQHCDRENHEEQRPPEAVAPPFTFVDVVAPEEDGES